MNFAAMTTTHAVDIVYTYIFWFCLFLLVGITATMIYFVVKYNHKTHPHPEPSPDSHFWLELTWFVIPTLIALSMFWVGWKGYATLVDVPQKSMTVHVTGRQWAWSFRYANGKTSDKLYVPVNRPIKLEITSKDVVHSFYVPAFRIKKDAVPGMTTEEWFRAPKEGSYDAYCTQYCGLGHSRMITKVVAISPKKFQTWYRQKPPEEEGALGKTLAGKNGCTGCHSTDGSKSVGPTWKGLFGATVTVTTNGKQRTLKADAAYIKKSISDPGADIVKGFSPIMPPFANLSAKDLDALVDYIRSLK